jgi:DNA-binding response OmpR family regulator
MPCLLVIAEDLERRRAWRQVFDHAGYAVMDARDGREGVHYSQTHVIDLVVLDVPLPLHQGIATLRALRHGAPAMRLLVLVDHDVLGEIDGGRMAQLSDADRVLQLPVERAVLLAAVRELLAMP